jgi:hypothetical protein
MRVSLATTATASLIAAALAAGCGEPVAPGTPTADLASHAVAGQAAQVPFSGKLEGAVTVTPLDPPMANIVIEATGTATQLGKFELLIPHLVNFATRTGTGTYTFTAANGDQLFASFTGEALTTPPIVVLVENATITGGTGRFAGATGSFTAHRVFDQPAGWTTGTMTGTISMTGSGKP